MRRTFAFRTKIIFDTIEEHCTVIGNRWEKPETFNSSAEYEMEVSSVKLKGCEMLQYISDQTYIELCEKAEIHYQLHKEEINRGSFINVHNWIGREIVAGG